MAVLTAAAPIAFGMIAAVLFYMAYQNRVQERFGRFDIMFVFGNLFVLATLWSVFLSLQAEGNSFADVVFPIFSAVLWLYVIINFIMFFNLIKSFMLDIIQNRGKRYVHGDRG